MKKKMIDKLWREQKYHVMFHSQLFYNTIRAAMRDNATGEEVTLLIHQALAIPPTAGSMRNAIQHMWGYFKKHATADEKARYLTLCKESNFQALLTYIRELAIKYDVTYLKESQVLREDKKC